MKIGEDVSKWLDVIPAQWRVRVTGRPKYICRRCSGAVVQTHAPEHVVPGGLHLTISRTWRVITLLVGTHPPSCLQPEKWPNDRTSHHPKLRAQIGMLRGQCPEYWRVQIGPASQISPQVQRGTYLKLD